MAIDVKELRVGAHVSIGSKMHRVAAIDALNGQIGIDAYKTDESGVKHPFGYKIEDIEPIPIAEELLTELGFHEVKDTYFSDWHKDWLKITNNTGQAKPYWTYNSFIKLYYLHQLEALYYAMNKTELIKEYDMISEEWRLYDSIKSAEGSNC